MKQEYGKLYDENDRFIMEVAEDSLNLREDRINEIINFAREAEYKKIGIANCIAFEKEAVKLVQYLEKEGFEVYRANCKLGKMSFDEIIPGYKGTSCNPAGQAAELENNNCEMNIVMGLCLGHDMVFNSKSKAPTTNLIVKDRKLKHHTLLRFENLK